MKQGMTLEELTEVVDFQHEHKRDFIVDTPTMEVQSPTPAPDNHFILEFSDRSRRKIRYFTYRITRYMLKQLAQHTHVPMTLVDRMVDGTETERAEIARVLTIRLQENPVSRLVRTITSRYDHIDYARAFLSDRYRTLDNYELLQAIFPVIRDLKGKLKLVSCYVNDTHMYIKLKYPLVSGSLGKVSRGDGFQVDDIVEAGVTITNSEVGDGPLKVQPYLLRLTCQNGATVAISHRGQRKIHIGRRILDTDDILNDRQGLSDEELFKRITDLVTEVVTDKKFFKRLIKLFRATKRQPILDAKAAVRVLAQRYKLSEWEKSALDIKMRRHSTPTRFHLINAVTSLAQSRVSSMTYARATELEVLGGQLIEMLDIEWKPIGSAKPTEKELLEI